MDGWTDGRTNLANCFFSKCKTGGLTDFRDSPNGFFFRCMGQGRQTDRRLLRLLRVTMGHNEMLVELFFKCVTDGLTD